MTARIGALAVVVGLAATTASAACRDDRVTIIGDFGRAAFTVDVADDTAERSRGLMFVEEMGTLNGMLFVYERPRHATFWMQNTLIPLDMLFARADGTIQTIHENAIPMDQTTIDGGENVLFVLEINGGMSARLGIQEGDALQHPAIVEAPRFPCDQD